MTEIPHTEEDQAAILAAAYDIAQTMVRDGGARYRELCPDCIMRTAVAILLAQAMTVARRDGGAPLVGAVLKTLLEVAMNIFNAEAEEEGETDRMSFKADMGSVH